MDAPTTRRYQRQPRRWAWAKAPGQRPVNRRHYVPGLPTYADERSDAELMRGCL